MMQAEKMRLGDRSAVVKTFQRSVAELKVAGSLFSAALSIALLEYPTLRRGKYLAWLDTQVLELTSTLTPAATTQERIAALNALLYQHQGFQGNASDYYNPANSFLNEVIERKRGIPITLSILYLELGNRTGLHLHGVGLPGHFLVRCDNPLTEGGNPFYIDPFSGGTVMDEKDCADLLGQMSEWRVPLQPQFLRVTTDREILTRMLNNLKNIYFKAGLSGRLLTLQEMLLTLTPENWEGIKDRAIIKAQLEDYQGALKDLTDYFEAVPAAKDDELLKTLSQTCQTRLAQLN